MIIEGRRDTLEVPRTGIKQVFIINVL